MSIDWNVIATIAAPIIALFIGAFIDRTLQNKPKVISYLGHVSGILLTRCDKPFKVHTHSLVLRNSGRKTAKNVRIGHNTLPDFQVYPDIEYKIVDLPGGQKDILFPKLIPQKQLTITYLYFPPLTFDQINTHIESDEGPAKVITVLPTPQLPKWLTTILWVLIVYGIIGVIYTFYTFFRWII